APPALASESASSASASRAASSGAEPSLRAAGREARRRERSGAFMARDTIGSLSVRQWADRGARPREAAGPRGPRLARWENPVEKPRERDTSLPRDASLGSRLREGGSSWRDATARRRESSIAMKEWTQSRNLGAGRS